MKLSELLEAAVRWLFDDEEFFPKLDGWQVRFADWPQGTARQAAERYQELRNEKGHTYAAIKTEQEFGRLLVGKIKFENEHTFRRLYFEAVNQANAIAMGQALIKNPEKGKEIAASFQFLSEKGEPVHFGTTVDEALARAILAKESGVANVTIKRWPCLSEMIGGFNPGRVGLLVAKTGFGKTNFAVNIALDASETLPTLFVNMEMISDDFQQKLIMAAAGVTYRELRDSPRENAEKIFDMQAKHIARSLFFTDGSVLTISDLAELARSRKASHGLALMIVDYDQKIKVQTSRETPEWKALQIAVETLEAIAKKHRIYVLLLAQEAGASDDGKSRGKLSGSVRSTFPASTVLNFFREDEDDGPFLVRAIKNRFGPRGVRIEVAYSPEMSQVREKGYYDKNEFSGSHLSGAKTGVGKTLPRASWHNRDD